MGVVALVLLGPAAAPPPAPDGASAGTVPSDFTETTVISGLTNPTVVRFSKDGRVFVAEKSGLIKVFHGLSDTTPTVFADLRTNVHNYWDRGLLGMALHPQFPEVPYVYALYTHDAVIGGTAPRWGTVGTTSDGCPTPPGPTSDGCVVSGRLSRLQADGDVMTLSEQVLVEDWCQQYPSHSVGTVEFGPDGALYASAGDGASFGFVDYGQDGSPVNPCGDPGGSSPAPPTAEGGALRSQDVRTTGDATGLDGTIIRVDPATGAGLPTNPFAGSSDANARRIIAHGMRNPLRFSFRPGTEEMWIGDVGWNDWEEINRVLDPNDSVAENFGWPCHEGHNKQAGYDAADLNLCETLYSQPQADTKPYHTYHHNAKVVPNESCPTGSSSIAGLSFEFAPLGSTFPVDYRGALFFADYSRDCIWAMVKNGNQVPSPGSIRTFVAGASNPVNLEFGPNGDLFYVDFDGGAIVRVQYTGSAPTGTLFTAPTPYPTAANAHGVTTADLNGDGKLDLAVANATANSVSVLLGTGTGTFANATNYAVGTFPKAVSAADVSGDGAVDLVTANQNSSSVSVLRGNGNGTFAAATNHPVCSAAHEVAIGNFNRDARPDIAVACFAATTVSVLLGTGNGNFGAAINSTAGSAPHSLVARDFDRDGVHDVAVTNRTSNNVSILRGLGTGSFASPVNYAVGTGPHSIRIGDFNGDGVADLATANDVSNDVSVLLGASNGTFSQAANYPTGPVPKGIAVGDFNGDGKRDLVTANTAGNYPSGAQNPGGDQVSVLLGNGAGGFGPQTTYLAGNTPFAVTAGDFDTDGQADLATANWFSNNTTVLLNTTEDSPPPTGQTHYLSDVAWTSMSNAWGPVERDMSNGESTPLDGVTITLNGTTYAKGLGTHAASDVRYSLTALGSNCNRFKADVGMDDEVGALGSVTFEVYADATKVYDSGVMTGATATRAVDVSVAGASQVRLVVTAGGDGINSDHGDWAAARVECGGGGGDTTPPTVTATSPSAGTTGVARNVSPTATFSEAMNASTLTPATFTLIKQGQSTPVSASVSYASQVATLDPAVDLDANSTYTATVKGGSAGAKDVAGNALASDASWSFTTGTDSTTATYLSDMAWTSMTNGWGPVERDLSNGESGTGDGITLTLNGTTYAKGLGTHAVSEVRYALAPDCARFKAQVGLDDEVGSLGSVVFEVYADASKIYDSGPMTGTSVTKAIDVSIAGASQLRLVVTNGGDNINSDHGDWALARIECGGAGGGDTTPPTVTGTSPNAGATGVALTVSPTATFSEAMNASTLTPATFTLIKQGQSTPVSASVSYASQVATLDPAVDLDANSTYTATVKGGSAGAKDVAGNALASDVSWSFTTGAAANQPPTPVIDTPAASLTWKVGDLISFTGHATDPEQGALPASSLSWTLLVQHCPSNCHTHTIQSWPGVSSGSFNAPDHEYPSYLELRLTATDAGGASGTTTLRLDPRTVVLTFASNPSGLQIAVNGIASTTPFSRTVIVGSSTSLSATSPQVVNGTTWEYSSWSHGGSQSQNIIAPAGATTYTANYVAPPRNTALPGISGTVRVGRTLTASNGTWTGSQPITFARQWLRCTTTSLSSCTAIAGATAPTYVITAADVDRRLRVQVTATNSSGTGVATSNATARVRP